MASSTLQYVLLLGLWSIAVSAQIISNLPACWQTCISQSDNLNCALTDIKCICRASNGNFLTDVVTCARGNCDNAMDANLLLTPLQGTCSLLGAPISPAAIRNAENAAAVSSPVASVTVTTTTVAASSSSSSNSVTTTTTTLPSSTTSASSFFSSQLALSDVTPGPSTYAAIYATSMTVTTTTTDANGNVYVLLLPTQTTMTRVTVLYPAGTSSGAVTASGDSSKTSGGSSITTSTTGSQSPVMTRNGNATSTGGASSGRSGTGTESLTAQETNGAPLDYYHSDGNVEKRKKWLELGSAVFVLACLI